MSGTPLFDPLPRLAGVRSLVTGLAAVAAFAAGLAAVGALAAGLAAVPATPDVPPSGPPVPGECLDIEVGAWRPPAPAGADSLALALPARVRLDDERLRDEAETGWSAPRRIETAPGALDAVYEERSWQEGPGGRLRLRFATRGSGVVVEARVSELASARATAWWDLPIPDHSAPVRLVPVDCRAPLPDDARFRWDFPVAVPIEDVPDLALGTPLPPGVELPPEAFLPAGPGDRIRLPEGADAEGVLTGAAFLAGAARIALGVADDGRLRRVVAAFREETVPRAVLLERLEAVWGPPDVMYGTTYRWLGRSLRYTMFAPTAEGWTVEMEVRTALIPA